MATAWTPSNLVDRGDRAFARLGNWLQLCQAIAELFYPERADFTAATSPGDERYWDIFDEEPMLLRRDLANQMGAMLRPRGRDWFNAKAFPRHLNDIDAVRVWCEDSTQTMRDVIYAPGTNFTRAFSQSDNDYVAFGTSIVTHTYNRDRTGLVFECLHPRDCAWEENSDGVIDVFHERMKKTMQQVEDMGFEIPQEWKERYEKDPQCEVELRRCVYPVERMERADGYRAPRAAKFAVAYICKQTRKLLKTQSGAQPYFRTWPYLVRRWSTVSGEPFGRSPCTSVALATARTLNQAQLSVIESLEKLVNPPLMAPDDGISGEVQIRANGITFYDPTLDYGSRKPIEALEVGRPDFGMEYARDRQAFLARAFLQNLIQFPQADKEMTAYEASKLWEQYMRNAAPVFEPMEAENAQLMEGVFERIYDADGPGKTGGFAPPPEELEGSEIKFEFETPLSEAHRRLKVDKALEADGYITQRMATNPGIIDLVDMDQMDRDALMAILPAKSLTPQDQVDERRAAREQAQQQQQAMQTAMEFMKVAGKGGAGGGGQSALPDLTGGASGMDPAALAQQLGAGTPMGVE